MKKHQRSNEKEVCPAAGLTATEVEGPNPSLALISTEPTKHTNVELFSASIGKFMDFRSLEQIEEAFVPLLEEVCSHHPSLIECQQERTRKFSGWAFNALGRVLYFLNTKRLKDMNDQCCKDLQTLWEELKIFGFDLTWLEPRVQSALGRKNYVEKAMKVEKRKAKLVAAEINLDAERELLKSKGFQVRDLELDAQL